MGEGIFREVLKSTNIYCRIYAPVGSHKDLLAYLVRRLLENGANSSFVHQLAIHPSETNGLQKPSQVMVDKAITVKRDKLGESFGSTSDAAMLEVGRCLAVFLGIAR